MVKIADEGGLGQAGEEVIPDKRNQDDGRRMGARAGRRCAQKKKTPRAGACGVSKGQIARRGRRRAIVSIHRV